ncbi:aspartate/glutamate racemase family protein [Chloroflexota bacterium]
MVRELIDNMRKKGQLEGVEIDVDDGLPLPPGREEMDYHRGGDFYEYVSVAIAQRVRYYSEMGKYDAIVGTGDLDPGFFAARIISKIPFTSGGHAALHIASLIGDRTTFIGMGDKSSVIIRRCVRDYGFDHKVVTVRCPHPPSSEVVAHSYNLFARDYKKEERHKVPEIKKAISDLTDQCIAAIEKDRVDSIILGPSIIAIFEDEVRQGLDKAGYSEIPIIVALSAAVEMAKAMVNMKLTQARRAYPTSELKAKPEFR